MINYPLKFTPILKEKIWGGNKLATQLNKKTTLSNVGESWEISDVEGNVSKVSNGAMKGTSLRELVAMYKSDLVGEKNYQRFGNDFPLLIKFIDAAQDLSVQVHPNDSLAKERHQSFGKTEMWYIIQADEGSKLIMGFDKPISKEEYIKCLENKQITSVLNFEPVQKGDIFFIETGTIHAIGAGIVLAEIQQTSDITYRVYDWDRVDDKGNSRELHTEYALDALNYSGDKNFKRTYKTEPNILNTAVNCEYFTTKVLPIKGKVTLDYRAVDSFVIFMCVQGSATISFLGNSEKIDFGETILIPATADEIEITSVSSQLLEVTL